MILKKNYIEYLLCTPRNYTCSNMAEHKGVSHDAVSDFLAREKFSPGDLWKVVGPHLEQGPDSVVIADDSVQSKKYSKFIELVKRQYSGAEGGLVRGIGLLNFVHSSGNDGDFFPIDYRVYAPGQDKKTKNDHFREMFTRLITHKNLQTRTILFDSWYASAENLKLIHRAGWRFFTPLKGNRLVSACRESGYMKACALDFGGAAEKGGLKVRLQKIPFDLRLFRVVSTDGDTEYILTNDFGAATNVFSAELKNNNRWQIEEFHRGFKQLTGSEKCQCRKAIAQRNHFACCYHAWVSLKLYAKKHIKTMYKVRNDLFSDFLKKELLNPTIPAFLG